MTSEPSTTTPIDRDAKVFVAGHRGLVGSAIVRRLEADGFTNVVTAARDQLDLRDQAAVNYWFRDHRPDHVFLVAGKVGGIMANSTQPATFLYDNLMIHATVVQAAHEYDVRKLLYLGSACVYPRDTAQPIHEDQLLTGPLEPTNEGYALAKITGMQLCESYREQYGCDFITAMPTNLYGPGDNFDLQGSHVLPALMRKAHEAKVAGIGRIEVWGSGTPTREFLHVDDLADACLFLMDSYGGAGHLNVGTGVDTSIRELAETVIEVVHPGAELVFDASKPDGMPRRVLDVSQIEALGWHHSTSLRAGIEATYAWFLEHATELRGLESPALA